MQRAVFTFAWVLGAVYSSIPALWLAIHPFAEGWRARRGKIYPLVGLIWLGEIGIMQAVTRPLRHHQLYASHWAWLLGAVLLVCGFAVYRRIGRDFGADRFLGKAELRPQENEQRLVTTGMHSRVRHPIYLAHLCMLTAWTLATGLAVMFAMWVFAVITGAFMIRMEERELAARFGDEWREYTQRVPAVVPKIGA